MKLIGIIADHSTPKATLDEVMFTTGASDAHRGGYCVVYRKRTSTRCLADRERHMQDTKLHGRFHEDTDSEE